MEIVERIERALPELSAKQQRAAQFLLDNLSNAAFYDSSEIADAAGVSNATMSRLVRALGFTDQREFKEHLRVLAHSGRPHARPLPADAIGQHTANEIGNLRETFAKISADDLQRAAELIHRARRVTLIGYRTSHPIALHLRGQIAQLRPGVALAPSPGHTLAEELASLDADDVVIVVGLRRRLEGFARILRQISLRSIPLVLLTDHSGRKYADKATVTFEVALDSVGGLGSYTAAMSVACLLENAIAGYDTAAVRRHQESINTWFEALYEIEEE